MSEEWVQEPLAMAVLAADWDPEANVITITCTEVMSGIKVQAVIPFDYLDEHTMSIIRSLCDGFPEDVKRGVDGIGNHL